MTNEERETIVKSLGLIYSAEFVPQSKSRNAGEKALSLNWRVTLKKNGTELTTDYMQGIGHHPNYRLAETKGWLKTSLWLDEHYRKSVEDGKYAPDPNAFFRGTPLSAPTLLDVLYSLVMDAEAIDYTFDEWASNYGYDTDSRKAEAIYRECLDCALKLRRMVGDKGLEQLREAFQDY